MKKEKVCSKCKTLKALKEFNKIWKDKDRLHSWCKKCQLVANKKYRDNHPEIFKVTIKRKVRKYSSKQEQKRDYALMYKYGINSRQLENMIINQDFKCAACNEDFISRRQTHVDHCHTTNKIRGILCMNCNVTLGYSKEDINRLKSLIKYLQP